IDLTDYLKEGQPGYNDGKGWLPIGPDFRGGFDGRGYEITGLWINRPDENNVGLFGTVSPNPATAETKNFTVRTAESGVIGQDNTGIIYGVFGSRNSVMTNVRAYGKVSGHKNVGGMFGTLGGPGRESFLSWLYCETDVVGRPIVGEITSYGGVGGMIGYSGDCTVTDSISIANVISNNGRRGYYAAGVFCGRLGFKASRCLAAGSVTGTQIVGGFCGLNKGQINQCAAFCDVTAISIAGGFAGETGHGSNTRNSYAVGTVKCPAYGAGFVGYTGDVLTATTDWLDGNYCAVKVDCPLARAGFGSFVDQNDVRHWKDNYFDADLAGTDVAVSAGFEYDPVIAKGLSVATSFRAESYAAFDFESIWAIDEGKSLPYFQWQKDLGYDDAYEMTGFSYDYDGQNKPITFEAGSRVKSVEVTGTEKTITFNGKLPGGDDASVELQLPNRDRTYTAHLINVSKSGIGTYYALNVVRKSERAEIALSLTGGVAWVGTKTPVNIESVAHLPTDTVYTWLVTAKPEGSNAKVEKQENGTGAITCDIPGSYTVKLTLSGGATGVAELTFIASVPATELPTSTPTNTSTATNPVISTPTPTKMPQISLLGDANVDNLVNIDDIMLVRDVIFGTGHITGQGLLNISRTKETVNIDAILFIRDCIFGGNNR
ncbi:MAG: hypothetical protein FWD16_05600, partial [Clostridia bacterium]|nr:hypothetical protein [Clostridia bacterium]